VTQLFDEISILVLDGTLYICYLFILFIFLFYLYLFILLNLTRFFNLQLASHACIDIKAFFIDIELQAIAL